MNARTLRAMYFVRRANDVVSESSGSLWRTFLDAAAGFNHIRNTQRAREMLAIVWRTGQFLPVCLTFGPHNGPEDFLYVIDRVYSPGTLPQGNQNVYIAASSALGCGRENAVAVPGISSGAASCAAGSGSESAPAAGGSHAVTAIASTADALGLQPWQWASSNEQEVETMLSHMTAALRSASKEARCLPAPLRPLHGKAPIVLLSDSTYKLNSSTRRMVTGTARSSTGAGATLSWCRQYGVERRSRTYSGQSRLSQADSAA